VVGAVGIERPAFDADVVDALAILQARDDSTRHVLSRALLRGGYPGGHLRQPTITPEIYAAVRTTSLKNGQGPL
jgi:hypothetical protein